MAWLKERAPKEEKHLLVTVAQHEVSVAVLRIVKRPSIRAKTVWQDVERVHEEDLHEAKQRITRYTASVTALLGRVPKAEVKHIKKIAVVLHHPWGGSFWKQVTETHQHPVPYTKQVRNRLENKARDEFDSINKASKDHTQVLVQLAPVYEELNGYTFQKPFKKRAEEITVTFQYDLVQKEIMEAAEAAIRKAVPHHHVEFFAYESLLEAAAKQLVPLEAGRSTHTTLFVLVESLRTDIILRDKRGHTTKKVVQIGFEALTEFIMRRFEKTHGQAEHLLELYLLGSLEADLSAKLDQQVREFIETWTRQVRHVVGSLLRDIGQPEQVLYTVSDECRQIIRPEHIERAIMDATPQTLTTTFFDFRDNVLIQDGAGIVSRQEVHLYVSSLL